MPGVGCTRKSVTQSTTTAQLQFAIYREHLMKGWIRGTTWFATPLLAVILLTGVQAVLAQANCGLTSVSLAGIPQWLSTCGGSPTDPSVTRIRPGAGAFRAPRDTGTPHQGVDVELRMEGARQCLANTRPFSASQLAVRAIADGRIAYSRLNSPATCPITRSGCDPLTTTGLGLTVIIDHGNGVYTLYAHLAQNRDLLACMTDDAVRIGRTMVRGVGERVTKGDVIGFLGQLGPTVGRFDGVTGNAVNVAPQVHVEVFVASAGRSSTGTIDSIISSSERGRIDPTVFLRGLMSQ
jgi:murein DD-endopeptidase MepM/ murein hydrolase activator NlpD